MFYCLNIYNLFKKLFVYVKFVDQNFSCSIIKIFNIAYIAYRVNNEMTKTNSYTKISKLNK